jgi:hypothetical protein
MGNSSKNNIAEINAKVTMAIESLFCRLLASFISSEGALKISYFEKYSHRPSDRFRVDLKKEKVLTVKSTKIITATESR